MHVPAPDGILLSAILEEAPDYVCVADLTGRILYGNRAAREHLFGLENGEELPEMYVKDRHPGEAGIKIVREARPVAMRAGVWRGTSVVLGADGRHIPVSMVIIAHKNSDGAPIMFSTIMRDVTEQKELEEQLRQSQKMDAVGRLAGGIAHDFNNLLTVISTNTELAIAQLKTEDDVYTDLAEIGSAVDRAKALTQQLLTFSRKNVANPEVLDVNSILGGMQAMLTRIVGEDISIVYTQSPERICTKADRVYLEQIVMNLIVNARDAMPDGGAILISTTPEKLDAVAAKRVGVETGDYVSITVSDTGMGIDPSIIPHIFEPFFTTKDQGKGTGLGLSTVYGIVKQFNGAIKVTSRMNVGTTFTLYLPVADCALVLSKNDDQLNANADIPAGKEVIMLVEDESGVREAVRRALERQGYTVLPASNGMEALIVCEEYQSSRGHVDLLLTDVVMPEINGMVLAERMHQKCPDLPVLYMSGFMGKGVDHTQVSPEDFIEKPFTIAVLMHRVRQILDRKRPAA